MDQQRRITVFSFGSLCVSLHFVFIQFWIWMCQYENEICLLENKVIRWRADDISLRWRDSQLHLVTVSESIQTQADLRWSPQCVQKHIPILATILKKTFEKKKRICNPKAVPCWLVRRERANEPRRKLERGVCSLVRYQV